MYAARVLGAFPNPVAEPEPAVGDKVRYNTNEGTIERVSGPWAEQYVLVLWDDGERDTYEASRLEHLNYRFWDLQD